MTVMLVLMSSAAVQAAEDIRSLSAAQPGRNVTAKASHRD